MRVLYALFLVCACALTAAAEDPFPAAHALLPQHEHSTASGPALTLDEIEQMALVGNPDIRVAVRRLAVVEAHVPTVGALDDPFLMYRGWGVPLRRPWDYNAAQNMFMLSQTFPGFGKRGLRTDIARSDVAEAKAALDNMRLDVRVRVRKAFYDLLRTQDELRIHDGHVAIARQAVEAARIKYTVGQSASARRPEGTSRTDPAGRAHDSLRAGRRSCPRSSEHAPEVTTPTSPSIYEETTVFRSTCRRQRLWKSWP